jgi:hypothetical protein
MAFRDPVHDDPTMEEWTIFPASRVDYATGVRRLTAQVPAGYEGRVDLDQPGIIRLRVPAGSRPVAVTRSVQAFTPSVPPSTPAPQPVVDVPDRPSVPAPVTAGSSRGRAGPSGPGSRTSP